jgi:hypothetical protein
MGDDARRLRGPSRVLKKSFVLGTSQNKAESKVAQS